MPVVDTDEDEADTVAMPEAEPLFSEEAADCAECKAEGFTINAGEEIADLGKFEGEPLVTFHAYHNMLNGYMDEEARTVWRCGNVVAGESNDGFVTSTTYDTVADAEDAFAPLAEEDEGVDY